MTPEWFAKKCGTCQLHTAQKLNWTWRIGVKRIEVNVYSCIEFESQVWARKELEKAAAQTRSGALTTLTSEVIWWHCSTVFRHEVIQCYTCVSDNIRYHYHIILSYNSGVAPKPFLLTSNRLMFTQAHRFGAKLSGLTTTLWDVCWMDIRVREWDT